MATRRRASALSWRQIVAYAALLAGGTAVLQWLDYRRLARTQPGEVYVALVAACFLAVGIAAGLRLRRPAAPPFDGNPAARASLGISPREAEVLTLLGRGLATKEIGRALSVSPNTVKTHLARLFEKLGAGNRTEAVLRAREYGLLP